MATTSYNLTTGLSAHPPQVAQVGDVAVVANGHDATQILDLRTGQLKTLGLAAPGAGTTATAGAAGNVNGAVAYRVRWADQSTGTIGLPSAAITPAAPVNKQVTINITALTPPARATHWIVERTTDGGTLYYRLNVSSAALYGTAVATKTYVDDIADSTALQNTSYPETQGTPDRFPICFENDGRVFMGGAVKHQATCSCNNADTAVTSSDGKFHAGMIGQDFVFDDDTDGVTYKISAVGTANALTLATAYAGTTKAAQAATIAGPGNRTIHSEAFEPEWFGEVLGTGKLSNELSIGDAGEDLTAGVAAGPGGVLWATECRLYEHSYRLNPKLAGLGGDGRVVPVQASRGAAGPKAMRRIDSRIFGVDSLGIWAKDPGAQPVEIAGAIFGDWAGNNLASRAGFLIGYDAVDRLVYFWVPQAGETYATRAYVLSLETQQWVGTFVTPWPVTAIEELPDLLGGRRIVAYLDKYGAANAYPFFVGIGDGFGPNPNDTLTGTVASGTSTTLVPDSATFTTTGDKLKGMPLTLVRLADGSVETVVIEDNSSTAITDCSAFAGAAPADGDTWIIGAIDAAWKTGRINPDPGRKKRFHRAIVWLEEDADAIDLKCRIYYDGSATAYADRAAYAEDGVTIVAGQAPVVMDPGAAERRYYVDLGGQAADDIQLELYSLTSGKPWRIVHPIELWYEVDTQRDPARAS